MRNVVLWIGMSVDGFTSGPNERLDWLVPHATTPEAEAIHRRLRERCDTVLVGRVNYEGFFGYWPKVKDDIQNSTRLTQSLLAAGLVDELYLTVVPVIVGEGRALFSNLPRQIDLRSEDLTRFDDGTLAIRYRVIKT